ncbi:9199_t:CDS:1 [Cetraspora pellucida]|uniref:9199_t:CDS:1 n=1 Tax=Cetraspora pellucida TaxID=1433469 RepID=A0A9N9P1N9_9GLOM|nr:9199_t:CDS:1 [Cetraspora pellucida]
MNSRFAFLFLIVLALTVTSSNAQNFCDTSRFGATNGTQAKNGSCSSTVQGEIPDVDHMISSLIIFPPNEASLFANQNFTVSVHVIGLDTGFFDNPATNYYLAPQKVNNNTGNIQGHSHITIQQLNHDNLVAPDPKIFASFKALNNVSINNILSQDVGPLPVGYYRICTMVSSSGHQPTLMPVAQRGSQDDCVRISMIAS